MKGIIILIISLLVSCSNQSINPSIMQQTPPELTLKKLDTIHPELNFLELAYINKGKGQVKVNHQEVENSNTTFDGNSFYSTYSEYHLRKKQLIFIAYIKGNNTQ